MAKSNKGVSLIESMVCIVIIGIGFIAVMQLSAFSISSMDRATERNKLNFLSETISHYPIAIMKCKMLVQKSALTTQYHGSVSAPKNINCIP